MRAGTVCSVCVLVQADLLDLIKHFFNQLPGNRYGLVVFLGIGIYGERYLWIFGKQV